MLTERVKILLRKQGTTFGDFIITDFEDPILKEHTVSVSVSDITNNLQVRQPLLRSSVASCREKCIFLFPDLFSSPPHSFHPFATIVDHLHAPTVLQKIVIRILSQTQHC